MTKQCLYQKRVQKLFGPHTRQCFRVLRRQWKERTNAAGLHGFKRLKDGKSRGICRQTLTILNILFLIEDNSKPDELPRD